MTIVFVDEELNPTNFELLESILRLNIDFITTNTVINFKPVSNGITNHLICAECTITGKDETNIFELEKIPIMVRIYGKDTDSFINRKMELLILYNLKMHHQTNCLVYFQFKNGFCYSFVEGNSMSQEEIIIQYNKITEVISSFHNMKYENFIPVVTEPYINIMFSKLIKLLTKVESENNSLNNRLACSSLFAREFEWLHKLLNSFNEDIVLCHNDILPGNLIYNQQTGKICLIDFEYSGPNYALFDIANYFCECLVNEPHQYGSYPTPKYQTDFLKSYYMKIYSKFPHDEIFILEKVRNILSQKIPYFMMMSHLFWGLWATAQYYLSEISFDYQLYAETRVNEYFKLKTNN